MKIGTIICNKWASESNPIRHFIYTGTSGKYATGIYLCNGQIGHSRYYKEDLTDKEKFVEVGYCAFVDEIKRCLMPYQPDRIGKPESEGK